jgi:hypothetical protein
MVESLYLIRTGALKVRKRMLIISSVAIEPRRTISKTTVLQTLHHGLPTLTLTHIFLSKKLKPKVTKSTIKLKTDQGKIMK